MIGKPTYTEVLQDLSAKIDGLGELASRQCPTAPHIKEILAALNKINGNVRTHGEILAANQQWIEGRAQIHSALVDQVRVISNRLWVLSGGTGILAAIALVLQAIG